MTPDHLPLGGGQQHPHPGVALGADALLEDLEVQRGLVDGHGDQFLGLELQRCPEVLLGHDRELGLTHDDALVGHPHDDALTPEAPLAPEASDRCRHCCGIHYLAMPDSAGREHHLGEALQHRLAPAHGELHGAHGVGAYVEGDNARHQALPR